MRRRIHIIVLALCIITGVGTANAWNEVGHQLVALVGYEQLSPAQRAACISILRHHPRFDEDFQRAMPRHLTQEPEDRWLFLRAAVWPDLVRPSKKHPNREKEKYHRGNWHFVNEPLFLTDADERALKNHLDKNLARTLDPRTPEMKWNILQALEHNLAVLRDEHADPSDRAVSLCWVLHLVGDIHQPLHSTALFARPRFQNGDLGGNAIPIDPPKNGPFVFPYPTMSLHSVWDDILGVGLSSKAINSKCRELLANPDLKAAGLGAAAYPRAEAWMLESHKLAIEVAYDETILEEIRNDAADSDDSANGKLDSFTLPNEYYELAHETAKQRVVEAGFRLATALAFDASASHTGGRRSGRNEATERVAASGDSNHSKRLTICSFNIQFLGQSKKRDNAALAGLVKDYDIVVVQEVIAPPYPGNFPDGTPFKPNPRTAEFFDAMKANGFSYWLSEEDTGPGEKNHLNSTATEWFVAFYKPRSVGTANDLPAGFLAEDLTDNEDFDRVPYAFSFRSPDRNLDFVLISVHLHPTSGTANAARRQHELSAIGDWVQSHDSKERDFIILGDMNIESPEELLENTPDQFKSINYFTKDRTHDEEYCLDTNTNVNGPKPYDHVMLNPQFTKEYDRDFGFQVIDLVKVMKSHWPRNASEPYPGEPYDHNAFRAVYTDHNPVVFVLDVPERDDD